MAPELSTEAAFEVIAKELRAFEKGNAEGAGDAVIMALSSPCRTYRRMRRSIDLVLPGIDRERPELAELLRFLLGIADRTCRAQGDSCEP